MKVAVIYPDCCSASAKALAKYLGADAFNGRCGMGYDVVLSYGLGMMLAYAGIRLNKPFAIDNCINKLETLKILKKNKIPHLNFTTSKKTASTWDWVVVRNKVDGAKNEGLEWVEKGQPIPKAPLYTEFFEHKAEYRIVVFLGKVIGRYKKQPYNGDWYLVSTPRTKHMDEACLEAARALQIDFVGFDVLSNGKDDFRICEANSGPVLAEGMAKGIKEGLKKLF